MTEKQYKKMIKDTLREVIIDYLEYGDCVCDFANEWEVKDFLYHVSNFEDDQNFILDKTLTKEIEKIVDMLRKM